MSRLDLMIDRLQSQRLCIDWAAGRIAEVEGPVLELGLGSGRTYDHLRERLAQRRIVVFDLAVAAHPDCVPAAADLVLGDLLETLPEFADRFGARIALIHADVGTADHAENRRLAERLAPLVRRLLRPGGVLISNRRELGQAGLMEVEMAAAAGHSFLFEQARNG